MPHSMRMGARDLLVASWLLFVAACAGETPKSTAKTDTAAVVAPASSPAPSAASGTSGASGTATAPAPASYVGLRFDPLPAGVTYEGGSVIMGKDGKPSPFVLSHVITPTGRYIWLDSVGPTTGVLRDHVVRAELRIPPVAGNEILFLGTCDIDKKLDGAVVAVMEHRRNQRVHTKVHAAWRANPIAGRFEPLTDPAISCEDAGR